MAWDTALARVIRETSRAEVNRKPQPLTDRRDFNPRSREGSDLIMTATARAKEWKVGMQAAALLHGAQLLVLDSL